MKREPRIYGKEDGSGGSMVVIDMDREATEAQEVVATQIGMTGEAVIRHAVNVYPTLEDNSVLLDDYSYGQAVTARLLEALKAHDDQTLTYEMSPVEGLVIHALVNIGMSVPSMATNNDVAEKVSGRFRRWCTRVYQRLGLSPVDALALDRKTHTDAGSGPLLLNEQHMSLLCERLLNF